MCVTPASPKPSGRDSRIKKLLVILQKNRLKDDNINESGALRNELLV